MAYSVCLLGECGVGKTSFLNRLSSDTFYEKYRPTLHHDYLHHFMLDKNREILFKLWDYGGNYKQIPHFDNFQIFILMYDIFNIKSFKKIDQWKNRILH